MAHYTECTCTKIELETSGNDHQPACPCHWINAEDADYVLVETMPEQHRESHRAAGNWGVYPANGATRQLMSRDDAEELVADDDDGYDRIIRDAKQSDASKYSVA